MPIGSNWENWGFFIIMSGMENPEFLKNKYDLNKSEEVEAAAKRTEKRTGEKLPQKPEVRIQNYLDRFKEIIDRKDPEERHRGMEAIKKVLHDKFVIKPEEIPESYFEGQRRIAREQGHGEVEITEEAKERLAEVVVSDQRSSLDNWIDYLASSDATYPDWLKYWTIRSVVGMGDYDKEKKAFAKRRDDTVKPFPDINREALAYVLDAVSQKYGKRHIELLALDPQEKQEFEKLLQGENFAKLYAWAIEKTSIGPSESLEKTAGKWVKYEQGSDATPLVESLQGHGTGWCTAGESTAEAQLQGGDFYVYYSLDKKGKPTIPRAAIRMQGDQIGEVRGIAEQQNLDAHIAPVVQEKMKEFPDGAKYEKKVRDMKFLTQIEKKTKEAEQLSSQELKFLYELDSPIEGFGYDRDPRIAELRGRRNSGEDMPILFECSNEQIAHDLKEIKPDTKAYVGKLEPGLFEVLPASVEHIYTKFPEGKIPRVRAEIDPSRSIDEMIKGGKYDYVNLEINGKNFKIEKGGETNPEVFIINFGEYIESTKEVLARLDKLGLRPARIEELLAAGEQAPNISKNSYTIALGSSWQRPGGGRDVPYLYDWGDGRELFLGSFEDGWGEDCRFAAVRK